MGKKLNKEERAALDGYAWVMGVGSQVEPKVMKGREIEPRAAPLPRGVASAVLGIIREGDPPADVVECCRQIIRESGHDITVFSNMDIYFQATGEHSLPAESNLEYIAGAHHMMVTRFLGGSEPFLDNFVCFRTTDRTGVRCCVYAAYK